MDEHELFDKGWLIPLREEDVIEKYLQWKSRFQRKRTSFCVLHLFCAPRPFQSHMQTHLTRLKTITHVFHNLVL